MITDRPRRLIGVPYVGLQRYFVTACSSHRRPVFSERQVATETLTRILDTARELQFAVVAYCLMPDHVHLLVVAESEQCDLERFVKRFKQLTGYSYRRTHEDGLWQAGYHERILRDDEATLTVARYILENPVRAGLATAVGEWPTAGSGVYSWPELLAAWEGQA